MRQVVAKSAGQEVFVCGGLGTPFWDCYFKIGFQGLMEMPYEEPDLFNYLLERQQAAQVALCQAYSQIGVHGIFIEECMTSADLISPKYYSRFVFPSTQAFLKKVQSLGVHRFLLLLR